MNPIVTERNCAALAGLTAAYPRIFVICDRAVRPFVDAQVLPALASSRVPASALEKASSRVPASALEKASSRVPVLELEATEAGKTLATVEGICSWLLEAGADRKSFVLAVGGGLTSDVVGFAASIYMRGISFAYVPTTLLAMTDAAIGGKTGVNFQNYKNILGTFCEPAFTYIATDALETLPRRDFLSGAAELLKTFIIENEEDNYAKAVKLLSRQAGQSSEGSQIEALTPLIRAAALVKGGIVTRDFKESGERKKLNLGHTFAHAIEHIAQEKGGDIAHGEAVAMGIVLAARLSERLGLAGNGLAAALETDFRNCGLRVDCPYAIGDMAAAMGKDKKSDGGLVSFVLIRSVGDVLTRELTPQEAAARLA